ncbi:MAG: DUF4956 domain-containing protein [Clostridium sp.]|nr:DUF4956 domain-containing protein [Clostridium sp.]
MSKTKILEWFSNNNATMTSDKIILYLFAAVLAAIVIFITYRITYAGVSYNNKFAITNFVILLIASVLMMMISSNIAISLGMVGALSIVRYRTAIKDPNDTLFLFWSIIEGLCVGAQMLLLAAISTLFIAIVVIILSYLGTLRQKYLLIIRGSQELSVEQLSSLINHTYIKNRIRTSNYSETGFEMIIEITSKAPINEEFIKSIRGIDGVKNVNWLLQTGEYIG